MRLQCSAIMVVGSVGSSLMRAPRAVVCVCTSVVSAWRRSIEEGRRPYISHSGLMPFLLQGRRNFGIGYSFMREDVLSWARAF